MAGKKNIGGLDDQVKTAFDEAQSKMGAGSANEALAALLERYDDDAMISAFDDIEVAGVHEVKRLLTQAARQMVMVLSHRYDEPARLTEADAKAIEALKGTVAGLEEQRDANLVDIADRDSTIADLRKKAASVDTLSERIDKMVETFNRQVDRYESDLAKMTDERDGLADQLKAMASERDNLASEVERLTAELAEVKAGKDE